jgi:hypothetical protein
MNRIAITSSVSLALLVAGLQAAGAGPFCMIGSLNFGMPDCTYRTWEQCRRSLGGMGDYCEPNTRGPYSFDLRDPAHPRVVGQPPMRYRDHDRRR